MKNMATKTRRHKEKIVRYRTLVDRFRTDKMAKKALGILFSHLAPMSISIIW